jgi:hypothetical protein
MMTPKLAQLGGSPTTLSRPSDLAAAMSAGMPPLAVASLALPQPSSETPPELPQPAAMIRLPSAAAHAMNLELLFRT